MTCSGGRGCVSSVLHTPPGPRGLEPGRGPEASPASSPTCVLFTACCPQLWDVGTVSLHILQTSEARHREAEVAQLRRGGTGWAHRPPTWVRSHCLHCRLGPFASELMAQWALFLGCGQNAQCRHDKGSGKEGADPSSTCSLE